MGKNVSTTVVACRLNNDIVEALRKMAKDRDMTVNAMLRGMLSRRVMEIREKEGW